MRGKGRAHCSAGAEEVAQSAASHAQLVGAGDGRGRGARAVLADVGDVACGGLRGGDGQRGDVGHVVCAGIVAIEQIEELHERRG